MRAAVVLIRGGQVALIRRRRAGIEYFLFPGGGIEPYETAMDAARREAREELGLEVDVGRLVATVRFNGSTQVFFAATEIDGLFGTGNGEELGCDGASPTGTNEPVWVALDAFEGIDVRPRALARLLAAPDALNASAPI